MCLFSDELPGELRGKLFGLLIMPALVATVLFCAVVQAAEPAANMQEQHYTFALVTHAQAGGMFWDKVRQGAAVAAEQHGIDLLYVHGDEPAKQAAKLENVITQGVDGIALTLAFPEAMQGLVRQAQAADIPVLGVNAGFNDWQAMGLLMYIGQDETMAGQAVGTRLSNEGVHKVLCVNHQQAAVQLAARCNGIEQTFTGAFETLFIDGFDMSSARARIMAKLMQDPAIDAVVTLAPSFAPVASKAAQMAHNDVKNVTFGLTPRTAKQIKSGQVAWAADVQPFLQGYEAIELLWLYKVNGDTLGGGQEVLTGPAFVDADNIDQIMPYAKRGMR